MNSAIKDFESRAVNVIISFLPASIRFRLMKWHRRVLFEKEAAKKIPSFTFQRARRLSSPLYTMCNEMRCIFLFLGDRKGDRDRIRKGRRVGL